MSNTLKTTLLLGVLTGLILAAGQLVGGQQGLITAFVFAIVMNFGSYWFSDKIVLAMYQAREVGPDEAPQYRRAVEKLVQRAGIPMPRLYILPTDGANAFATGRNPSHAAVAVTEGILRLMSQDELEGVLAHELSHIKNRDILISSIAATLAGVLMMLARMAQWGALFGGGSRDERNNGGGIGLIVVAILTPIAAMLIQMAISRSREFQADASGAEMAGSGDGLARALEKLHTAAESTPMPAMAQTAHMFIFNPLSGQSFAKLFSTHPPVEERIARLRALNSPFHNA